MASRRLHTPLEFVSPPDGHLLRAEPGPGPFWVLWSADSNGIPGWAWGCRVTILLGPVNCLRPECLTDCVDWEQVSHRHPRRPSTHTPHQLMVKCASGWATPSGPPQGSRGHRAAPGCRWAVPFLKDLEPSQCLHEISKLTQRIKVTDHHMDPFLSSATKINNDILLVTFDTSGYYSFMNFACLKQFQLCNQEAYLSY